MILSEATLAALPALSDPSLTLWMSCLPGRHCFADWWAWQQSEYVEAEARIICEYGGDSHMARVQVQQRLPPKADGIFAILCPTCRSQADHSALSPWLPRLQERATTSGGGSGPTPVHSVSGM